MCARDIHTKERPEHTLIPRLIGAVVSRWRRTELFELHPLKSNKEPLYTRLSANGSLKPWSSFCYAADSNFTSLTNPKCQIVTDARSRFVVKTALCLGMPYPADVYAFVREKCGRRWRERKREVRGPKRWRGGSRWRWDRRRENEWKSDGESWTLGR